MLPMAYPRPNAVSTRLITAGNPSIVNIHSAFLFQIPCRRHKRRRTLSFASLRSQDVIRPWMRKITDIPRWLYFYRG